MTCFFRNDEEGRPLASLALHQICLLLEVLTNNGDRCLESLKGIQRRIAFFSIHLSLSNLDEYYYLGLDSNAGAIHISLA